MSSPQWCRPLNTCHSAPGCTYYKYKRCLQMIVLLIHSLLVIGKLTKYSVNNIMQVLYWVAFSFMVLHLLFCCPGRSLLADTCSWLLHTCTFPLVHSSPVSWTRQLGSQLLSPSHTHTWGSHEVTGENKPHRFPLKDSVQWTSITLELLQWKRRRGRWRQK